MPDFGELADQDVTLYRHVLLAPDSSVSHVAEALGTTSDEIDKAVSRLSSLGLLRVDDNDRLTAVSPLLAEATVLGAEDLEISARRAALEQRRDAIRQLVPSWNSTLSQVDHEGVVEVVNEKGMANVLMHYADTCRDELLSIAPGRMAATRIDGRTRVANVYSSRRGIKTRAIYQHVALRDRATRSYLNELAQNGAKIRLTPSVPGRGLVVDRSVALLPVSIDSGGQGLAIVRDRYVVAWVVATFEQLWAEASPLEDVINKDHDETELDQTRAAILRLMAEGEKDEAISRRLSISVRTCRRHIADYMAQVGALSRFQAGVIAARAGHTEVQSPPD
jgi:DNA-binding NarL/FixJ family response regulator